MTINASRQAITFLSLALCLAATLGAAEVRERAEPNGEQAAATVQPAKTKKQSKKAQARDSKQLMMQLESGHATPGFYAECLARDASRIAATVDHPNHLGIAVIKALKNMPREKVRNEVLPVLEEKFQEMLQQKIESSEVTSQLTRSTANAVIIDGAYVNMVNALAAIGPDAHPVLARGLSYNPAVDLFITRKLAPNGIRAGSHTE